MTRDAPCCALASLQVGVVMPGQMFTIVMEKMCGGKVRAMIAMDTLSFSVEHTQGTSLPAKRHKPSAADPAAAAPPGDAVADASGTDAAVGATEAMKAVPAAVADVTATEAGASEAAGGSASQHSLAEDAPDADALTAKLGWVTLVKDGARTRGAAIVGPMHPGWVTLVRDRARVMGARSSRTPPPPPISNPRATALP